MKWKATSLRKVVKLTTVHPGQKEKRVKSQAIGKKE